MRYLQSLRQLDQQDHLVNQDQQGHQDIKALRGHLESQAQPVSRDLRGHLVSRVCLESQALAQA